MHRHYNSDLPNLPDHQELAKQTVFHEAGHAAAIYLSNKQKKLPPVFFKIQILKPNKSTPQFSAKVIGGQLIQNLPITLLENLAELSNEELQSYQSAFEADVLNLLVGPLAEAKYVSIRDDEIFNHNLISPLALNFYGGYCDVEKANSYLEIFISDKSHREIKLQELFNQAYEFIEDRHNWNCIMSLAHYILEGGQTTISCEKAISIFDNCAA